MPDLESTIVAGVAGATLLFLLVFYVDPVGCSGAPAFTPEEALGYGFAVGASVQLIVRLTGVS